jgi:hypothetical protein
MSARITPNVVVTDDESRVIYRQQLLLAFPYAIECSRREANAYIRKLLENGSGTGFPHGSSCAYTRDLENRCGGILWLSAESADRIGRHHDAHLSSRFAVE